jgi:hypothetical protein
VTGLWTIALFQGSTSTIPWHELVLRDGHVKWLTPKIAEVDAKTAPAVEKTATPGIQSASRDGEKNQQR